MDSKRQVAAIIAALAALQKSALVVVALGTRL